MKAQVDPKPLGSCAASLPCLPLEFLSVVLPWPRELSHRVLIRLISRILPLRAEDGMGRAYPPAWPVVKFKTELQPLGIFLPMGFVAQIRASASQVLCP